VARNNNQIVIIIPTYNEIANIERLTNEIITYRPDADILIIDDNSPDGTANLIEKMGGTHDQIRLIRRSGKMGYGSACQEGFKWALRCKNYKYIITMDADFSHHPKFINGMLQSLETQEKAVAIGSRYIEGGGVKNWGINRRILSRGANLYSRLILGIPVSDCTSGFRCYRRELIEDIDFSNIISDGYSFLEEILYICKLNGASIGEVPIIFENRRYGKSKINKKEIFKAMIKVPKLRISYWFSYHCAERE
jgi:dolichol-phosphate mannosyltransferase